MSTSGKPAMCAHAEALFHGAIDKLRRLSFVKYTMLDTITAAMRGAISGAPGSWC